MTDSEIETTEHLTCPWCQYDLCGLPVKHCAVRCPECGQMWQLRLLEMSAGERAALSRGLRSLPITATALMVMAAILGFHAVAGGYNPICAPPWMACSFLWAGCVGLYMNRYQFVGGAARVLVLVHLAGLLFAVALGMMFPVVPGVLIGTAIGGPRIVLAFGGLAFLVAGGWLCKAAAGVFGTMRRQLVTRA